eukprot:gene5511-11107_t
MLLINNSWGKTLNDLHNNAVCLAQNDFLVINIFGRCPINVLCSFLNEFYKDLRCIRETLSISTITNENLLNRLVDLHLFSISNKKGNANPPFNEVAKYQISDKNGIYPLQVVLKFIEKGSSNTTVDRLCSGIFQSVVDIIASSDHPDIIGGNFFVFWEELHEFVETFCGGIESSDAIQQTRSSYRLIIVNDDIRVSLVNLKGDDLPFDTEQLEALLCYLETVSQCDSDSQCKDITMECLRALGKIEEDS